jgi:1,4-alpha-glucan branching enzyme
MSDPARLYDEDFVLWTEAQARALRDAARAGANLPLDWEHLAEEVEDLGKTQARELESRLATILEHLVKLEYSTALDPRRGWVSTVRRERREIERLLRDNPSLRRKVAIMIEAEAPKVAHDTALDLHGHGEGEAATLAKLAGASYTEGQVLGDWFPAVSDAPAA